MKRMGSQPLESFQDGTLYVADFTNFCVVRFGAGDAAGKVVAGEEAKQLMDVDYLKEGRRVVQGANRQGREGRQPTTMWASKTAETELALVRRWCILVAVVHLVAF